MSVLKYRVDDVRDSNEDGVVVAAGPLELEDACWDSPDSELGAAVSSSLLRSTPSTILEPEG